MDAREHAARVHAEAMVIDAHADIEIPGKESPYVGADGRSKVAPDKLVAGGVDAVVLAVAAGPGPCTEEGYVRARRRAEGKFRAVTEMIEAPDNRTRLARSPEDVERIKADGDQAVVLGFQNTQIVGRDVSRLAEYHQRGVGVFALTHIGHNDCADSSRPNYIAETGAHEPTEVHGGLSDLGRDAVALVNDLGGLLDVSQMSRNATLQALERSRSPVIASHSNARALCDVSRNLSDEEIDAIGASGGVVHVSPFRGYLFDTTDQTLVDAIRRTRLEAGLPESYLYPFELYWEIPDPDAQLAFRMAMSELLGPGRMDQLMAHVDYVANRIGVEHVGFGSDFNHGGGMKGFDEAHDAPFVTQALLQSYSPREVDLIWGRNFLRAWAAAQENAR